MYLDNLPNRKVSELKQEFYRLRNVDKFLLGSYEIHGSLLRIIFRGVEPVINKYSYVVLNHHILYYNDCNDGICGVCP